LLVHGFPLDHTMWNPQIEHFAATHTVIAPDLRGFGRSDVTTGVVMMEQFADDLSEMLDELAIAEPVVLCGLSMGGYIAFQFVRRHRGRLVKLILCDTRAAADAPEAAAKRHETADRVAVEGPEFLATSMIERLFAPWTRERNPQVIAATQAVIRRTSRIGIAGASRGMAERSDATPLLAGIDVPTLVVVGEHDAISPPAEMRDWAGCIPQAEFVVLADAGHMAPLEQPTAFHRALQTFLQR
jgi:pimeloyl-ACP methyl ester carboxylesterase